MNNDIQTAIQQIKEDLELLRNKQIHELQKKPGIAKCETLADRIDNNLDYIVDDYEESLVSQTTKADEDQFRLLYGLLNGLTDEIAALSKKQPDGLINRFKVTQINKVLIPLKEIMTEEPSNDFLVLVAEVEEKADKSRNSYSDAMVILSQYKGACENYNKKYYKTVFFS